MKNPKQLILWFVIALILASILYLQSQKPERTEENSEIQPRIASINKEEKARQYQPAKEISSPDGFINTELVTIGEFVGKKVVLVDFWTYSCINCQRTIPYLNAWHEKYSDKGLVIIGVHTPEFQFEHKYENVLQAVQKFGIKYPVVLDNDYSTWDAYGNRYWPHKYLIDIDGFIVYDHIGEGGYAETENKIKELLGERSSVLGLRENISGVSEPENMITVDFGQVQSPEVYFGAGRNTYLGNGVVQKIGIQTLAEPADIETNILYLTGEWNFEDEFAENKNAPAKIIFRYRAKDVYLVASSDQEIRVKVLLDGKAPGEASGEDVKISDGSVTVKEDRLYKIIEGTNYGEHTLELIIENPGLRTFTFTFG